MESELYARVNVSTVSSSGVPSALSGSSSPVRSLGTPRLPDEKTRETVGTCRRSKDDVPRRRVLLELLLNPQGQ